MNYNSTPGVVSRALQEANDRKARKLTFYKNGEPFANCITVSILPGRDFRTMDQLCAYLTEKIAIANGVQYIFTTNGQRVVTLNELEHGMSYVVSGVKNFHNYPYGQLNKLRQIGGYAPGINPKSRVVRDDDLRLLRPLSSKYNTVYHNISQAINTSYKEGRIITIVNNKDHKIRSRVLLNLKSPKSFDIIVKDLGQAVRIKNAKRMFTASGHEVRSVSQLKRDMIGVDLFYLESSLSKSPSFNAKSYSIESIAPKKESKRVNGSNDSKSSVNSHIDRHIEYNGFIGHKRSDSSNFSGESVPRQPFPLNSNLSQDINPSRRGESSLSERLSLNLEFMAEHEYQSGSKNGETQTSPEFVRSSRKAKKNMRREKSRHEIIEPEVVPNHLQAIHRSLSSPHDLSTDALLIQKSSPKRIVSKPKNIETNRESKKTPKHKNIDSIVSNENTKNKMQTQMKGKDMNVVIDNEENNRRDALQEYAETLLRETALMVQNESIRQDSIDEVIDKKETKTSRVTPNPKPSPKKSPKHMTNDNTLPKPKSRESYVNEVKDRPKSESESEEETETEDKDRDKVPNEQNGPNSTTMGAINSPKTAANNPSPLRKSPIDPQMSPQIQSDNKSQMSDPLNNLRDGSDIPDKYLRLKWVHGFNGTNGLKSLFNLSNGELVFFVGTVAVLWNPELNVQRLYTSHTNDINRMAVRRTRNVIATSQEAGKGEPFAVIRVWSSKDMKTYAIITQNIFGSSISDMDFSIKGSLMVVNGQDSLNLTVWDWKTNKIMASSKKELKNGESVKGSAFHQTEDDIMVSFGNKHLNVWQRRGDGTIDSRTAIKPDSKAAKNINCVDFLPDHSLLTGDTTGTLTIWAPLEDENGVLEFVVKEVKGHDQSITCLQLLENNILISGDFDGTVKTWDVNDEQFRLLNAIKLPPTSGAISSIARVHYADRDSDAIEIYLGTSLNLILRGSALQATNYTVIFEGHSLAIRGLAVDPKREFAYSCGLDQKVCKWSDSNLLWRTTAESQCVSASVHPNGEVLAVGSVIGTIFIMNTSDGNIVSQLPVSKVCIGCLSYSPDGDLLAAGCQDGILYILPALDNGYSYEKVSVLKGPLAILSLQWSIDSQFVLTSVNENNYQELLLWDLPNCRYMKGITDFSDTIIWFDPTCSGGEDVRGIWDNRYLQEVVNLSCHCSGSRKYLASGDEDGFIRMFSYPCHDSNAGFVEYRPGGGSVTEVRFLYNENFLVSANYGGAVFMWQLLAFPDTH